MTGAPPEVNDVITFDRARWDFLEKLRWKVGPHLPRRLRRALYELGWKLGLMTLTSVDHLRKRGLIPVFDLVKSIVIDFPVYDERLYRIGLAVLPIRSNSEKITSVYWRINKKRYRDMMNILRSRNDWKLLAVYYDIADCVGHRYMATDIDRVKEAYEFLNNVVKDVYSVISDFSSVFILIVSDHGMDEQGEHSPRAFYSFSHKISWRPRRISDYKEFIINLVNENIGIEGIPTLAK